MGSFPIRDIVNSLPDVADDFTAHTGLTGLRIGEDARAAW